MNNPNTFLPAEWAHQHAVLLTWPHKNTDWAPILAEVDQLYLQLAKEILKRENLIISCADENKLEHIKSELDTSNGQYKLSVYHIASDDTWARDHGPITVFKDNKPVLLDFNFNAWGDKFQSDQDNLINIRLQQSGAFPHYLFEKIDLVLEGGSIESNGEGVMLTTSECLLSPTRNPSYSKQTLEQTLQSLLGIKEILWLDHGFLAGDDTDSHIDTLARFCAADLICYVKCEDPNDPHFEALNKMEAQLQSFRQPNGEPYRLKALPMAEELVDDGERLPATYANFLIVNGAVLVPVYGVEQDQPALTALQECFPEREIVPINCYPLIKQHGSLHCITMQIPAGDY